MNQVANHSCNVPGRRLFGRRPWTCPICRRVWTPEGKGGLWHSDERGGEIVSVTFDYPDGARRTFGYTVHHEGTFSVDLPCPDCGHRRIIGWLYVDENGAHMHTRYVCTFWRSGRRDDGTYVATKPCGWMGSSVPGWETAP